VEEGYVPQCPIAGDATGKGGRKAKKEVGG